MAFTIHQQEKPDMYISDKRLYLTPGGEVSEEPVSGGSLLVPKGGEMSNADAEKYGLKAEKQPENKGLKGLGQMNKAELEAVATERGLETGGTKAELLVRIEEAEVAGATGGEPTQQ